MAVHLLRSKLPCEMGPHKRNLLGENEIPPWIGTAKLVYNLGFHKRNLSFGGLGRHSACLKKDPFQMVPVYENGIKKGNSPDAHKLGNLEPKEVQGEKKGRKG
jgi:hypothetical protein